MRLTTKFGAGFQTQERLLDPPKGTRGDKHRSRKAADDDDNASYATRVADLHVRNGKWIVIQINSIGTDTQPFHPF